jgi:hypothetical protein
MIALRLSFCVRAQNDLDLRLQNFEIKHEGKQVALISTQTNGSLRAYSRCF